MERFESFLDCAQIKLEGEIRIRLDKKKFKKTGRVVNEKFNCSTFDRIESNFIGLIFFCSINFTHKINLNKCVM